MKTNMNIKTKALMLSMAALSLLFWYCSEEKEQIELKPGEVAFTFSSKTTGSGRTKAIGTPAYVKYALKNAAGESQVNVLPLYPFGNSYVSDKQVFQPGRYALNEYYILNASEEIIYAAVVQGAPLANLVEQRLPLPFDVSSEETTLVAPEVLPVTEETTPGHFGYTAWSYKVAAKMVRFILPLQADLSTKFKSGTLTITQGSYTKTTELKGMPATQPYADVLVKPSTPVQISLVVDMDNMHITSMDFTGVTYHVLNRTSISQFELTQSATAITGNQFTFAQFKYKIGKGWNFKFAEITTNGQNGSWFKVKYQGSELCSQTTKITSNASSFDAVDEQDASVTDKCLWSGPGSQNTDLIDRVNAIFAPNVYPPVCSNGTCSLTGYMDPTYDAFLPACESNNWYRFDAITRIVTNHNGQRNVLNAYFNLERDVD
jgi:hypothetical protein